MTENHPTTPPPELIEQWMQDHTTKYDLARHAAQWGADHELEACCEWLEAYDYDEVGRQLAELLRAAGRPKQPSLKEQALMAINAIDAGTDKLGDSDIIRRALEALPEPQRPTDEELVELFNENDWNFISPETFIDIARSVLELQ